MGSMVTIAVPDVLIRQYGSLQYVANLFARLHQRLRFNSWEVLGDRGGIRS